MKRDRGDEARGAMAPGRECIDVTRPLSAIVSPCSDCPLTDNSGGRRAQPPAGRPFKARPSARRAPPGAALPLETTAFSVGFKNLGWGPSTLQVPNKCSG